MSSRPPSSTCLTRLSLFEESLDAVAEDQLSYLKTADFNTISGALVFFDGAGSEAITLGAATFEPVTVAGE